MFTRQKNMITNHPILSYRKQAELVLSLPLRLMIMAFILFAVSGAGYAATNYYVWRSNPSPATPFTNWAMAATSIQDAVNLTLNNDTVYVTNGTYNTGGAVTPGYSLTNRVCVTKAITLRSFNNDPANTIIKGKPDDVTGACGDNAIRCVYLTNGASLIGFTLTNGYTMTNGNGNYDRSVGGVFLDHSVIVSNCIISGNKAFASAGGAMLYKGGTLNNCTLAENTADNSGGAYVQEVGTLNNCTLARNTTLGTWGSGGICCYFGGTLNNCTVVGNWAQAGNGGGVYLYQIGTMNNCLVVSNRTARGGGGVSLYSGGIMINCTVVGNKSDNDGGGGVYYNMDGEGVVSNCVVWGNIHSTSSNIYILSGATVNYTCSGPAQSGAGNIGSDPLFVSTNSGNYRLAANSPCINTGSNQTWMTNSYDLDGRTRIRYGTVDMGAYELIYDGTIYKLW